MNWNETKAAAAATLRTAYLAEVERFAETLRPRFESGELRGFREGDGEIGMVDDPRRQLERLCATHFGLDTVERPARTPGWISVEGDDLGAHLILAASRYSVAVEEASQGAIYDHSCQQAVEAVAWDVLAVATSQGWYRMTEDEVPSAADLAASAA